MKESGPSGNFLSNNFPKRDFSPVPPSQPSQSQGGDRRIDDLKRQLDVVNSKLDTLIKGMERAALAEMSLEDKKTTPKKLVTKATATKKTTTKKK